MKKRQRRKLARKRTVRIRAKKVARRILGEPRTQKMEVAKYRFLVLTCGHVIRRPKAAGEPAAKLKDAVWCAHCPQCKQVLAVDHEQNSK
jgi:hypothetical protein